MTFSFLVRTARLIVFGFAIAGCAREDGSRIIGKWRAERVAVASLKLPLGPELEITRNKLVAGSDVSIPIAAIMQDGDEVTLDTHSLIGMTFYFVGADRIYLDLPVVGRLYYRRVNDQALAAAVTAPKNATVPAQAAALEPAHAQDYAKALVLVRQGDLDGAVRSLHDAFKHGFRDTPLLNRTPEFDVLKADVRYQALVVRYTGH
jgi:hypothetical protein